MKQDSTFVKAGEILFFTFLGGTCFLFGFSRSLSKLKHNSKQSGSHLNETGEQLAVRALKRGSLYAVLGFTVVCSLTSYCIGIKSFQDIKEKAAKLNLKKNVDDKTEKLQTLQDLVDYITKSK